MNVPGIPSLFFLAYLLIFLPWLAYRSSMKLRSVGSGNVPANSRESIYRSIVISQAFLFFLAWITGRTFEFEIFAMPSLRAIDFAIAAAAFGICLVLRWVARIIRPENERRKLFVFFMAPRTKRERVLWVAAVLVAAVAEEAAYRGVGMSVLWYSLGNPWIAALISGGAFSMAHWIQGWKSGIVIFAIALAMQGLVALTGTLVLAMIVHASYDFVAGWFIGREAARYDKELAHSILES